MLGQFVAHVGRRHGSTSPATRPAELEADAVIQALYRLFLGRDADPEGLAAYRAAIASGLSVEEVVSALVSSREFARGGGADALLARLDVKAPDGDHPLARWPWIYTVEHIPYFSRGSLFRPAAMILETVNICNNSCVICSYPVHTRPKQTMSLALFARAIEQYAAIGGGHLSLTPMLGELFVDKLLPERLALLARTRQITSLSATTNAVMARRYDEAELATIIGVFDRVYISIYGLDRDEYQRMTRKDEFDMMEEQIIRIVRLAKAGSVVFGFRNLVARTSEEMDAWASKISDRAGVDLVPIHSSTHEYHRWGGLSLGELPFDGRWTPARENTEQCLLPLSAIQVLADGTISFCSCADFNGNPALKLGNIETDCLETVLRSERYMTLWDWKTHGVPDFCKSCGFHKPMQAAKDADWDPSRPITFIGG